MIFNNLLFAHKNIYVKIHYHTDTTVMIQIKDLSNKKYQKSAEMAAKYYKLCFER